MADKPRSSKSMSEDDFNAQLRADRARKPVSHSMVMTHPPSGPSLSLEEVLREHQPNLVGADHAEHDAAVSPVFTHKYQKIAVSLIDPNHFAPREVYTPKMIQDRAEALRTQGQHDPIHVIPNPEKPGRYIICDGWTRVQACRDHKVMHELLAEVHEGMTLEESAWFGYQQNEEREQHCDLDRAMFYEKLIAAGESAAEIARKAGVSRSQMTFYRAFSKLPLDVIEIIRTEPSKVGANAAYQISKIAERVGVKQATRITVKFVEENHTYSWLVNQVQTLLQPKRTKQPSASKQIRFNNGYYKQRGDTFEVSIVVDPSKSANFAAELEILLATVAVETEEKTEKESNKEKDIS